MEPNVLFISIGIKPPALGGYYFDRFNILGKYIKGHSLTAVNEKQQLKLVRDGNFTYHSFLGCRKCFIKNNIVITIVNNLLLFRKAFEILQTDKSINIIIARTPFLTALVGLALGIVFRRKTLVEINGNFKTAFRFERVAGPKRSDLVKEFLGSFIIGIVLKNVSGIKLLYSTQIACYNLKLKNKPIASFHDFVPISKMIDLEPADKKYILTLGYPWYLKGVDTLIMAFKLFSREFPQYKLKIYGWCPYDREYFEKLSDGNELIELGYPVQHNEAISLISNCSVFVLASRTEAMGRVLLEAMVYKKPIIASNVGGIPSVVKDGFNGLLFTPGDVTDLVLKMKNVISRPEDAHQLAINGYSYVREKLNEDIYAKNYQKLLEEVIGKTK